MAPLSTLPIICTAVTFQGRTPISLSLSFFLLLGITKQRGITNRENSACKPDRGSSVVFLTTNSLIFPLSNSLSKKKKSQSCSFPTNLLRPVFQVSALAPLDKSIFESINFFNSLYLSPTFYTRLLDIYVYIYVCTIHRGARSRELFDTMVALIPTVPSNSRRAKLARSGPREG